jgi:hypothetical protein
MMWNAKRQAEGMIESFRQGQWGSGIGEYEESRGIEHEETEETEIVTETRWIGRTQLLVMAAQEGDAQAFEQLVRRWQNSYGNMSSD